MKTKQTIVALFAAGLVGPLAAQQDNVSRSYQQPIPVLDESWLNALSSRSPRHEQEFVFGPSLKMSSPLLSFVAAPQRVLEPTPVTQRVDSPDRIDPPPTFSDVTRQKSHLEILRFNW